MQPSQIGIWIETGQNVLTADIAAKADELPSEDYGEIRSSVTTSDGNSSYLLVGALYDDPLIPTSTQIAKVYHDGEATWLQLLEQARGFPEDCYPPTACDPSIIMKDVPALPEPLPKVGGLWGWAKWQLSSPPGFICDDDWSAKSSSPQQYLSLSVNKPLRCIMETEPTFAHSTGVSLLTLCWSYIFSVRMLESQGRTIRYTQSFRQTASTTRARSSIIDLKSASAKLVRWVSAILSRSMGWDVKGPLPPWAVYIDAQILIILSDRRISYDPEETPPSASEAVELLIELCSLFGLAPAADDGIELAPLTKAFLATLTIPFYQMHNLTPRLSFHNLGILSPTTAKVKADVDSIRKYVADLRYYMTLSLSTYLSSIIWSIFWQPDITCNLVSPWYASILHVLKPLFETCNVEIIAKVFILRRPRIGLWWFGIFLLGDLTILDWIERFLETLEERYGYGTGSIPDLVMAAWSGVPQSFLDKAEARAYSETEDIPRREVLWHRHNSQLDRSYTAWPPSGSTNIKEVEVELWPLLEKGASREYLHWVWITNGNPDIQYGFSRDTGRFIEDVPDRLDLAISKREQYGELPKIKVTPSKEATLRTLALAVEDAAGDVHPSNACLGEIESHKWLRHWRGLEALSTLRIYEALGPYVEDEYVRFAIKDGGEEVKVSTSVWKEGYHNGRLCWWCISEKGTRYYWCDKIRGKNHGNFGTGES